MSIVFQITTAGRTALINAAHDGTNAVQVVSCGLSGAAVVPAAGATTLPGEFKRLTSLSGAAVAADVIHVVVRDESTDAYTARSLALYLADGTLFGIYGQADPIINKAAGALGLLAVDITLVDVAAGAITFGNANFLNPPATTGTAGVVELADDAEAAALVDALRALTPRGLGQVFTAAKILAKLLTADGAGSGLDADLLDGQEGAYYSNVTARLGYTPLNATAYTAADVLGKLVAVDGAGSGLDADLLDGQQAAAFARLDGAAFTGRVSIANGSTAYGQLVIGSAEGAATAAWFSPQAYFSISALQGNAAGARITYSWSDGGQGPLTIYNAAGEVARFTPAGVFNAGVGLTRAGNPVWDTGNDGAGSGLDADLLDGQEGAYYTNITARLGFIPVQQGTGSGQTTNAIKIGWSAASRLKATVDATDLGNFVFDAHVLDVWRSSNDGAGSGLDADLLDGQQGSWYADILARLGYTPLNVTAYTAGDIAAKLVTVDGAGSGIDADLLDGIEGNAFDRVVATDQVTYRQHADGFIECQGITYCGPSASTYVPLPVAHASWCVPVGSCARASDSQASIGVREVVGSPPTGFNVKNNNNEGVTFYWHTRGK